MENSNGKVELTIIQEESRLEEIEFEECAAEHVSFRFGGAVASFLSFSGGSILYCLSAASIIYGLGRIIGPTLASSVAMRQTLPCVLAVNLYELALICILVLIVVYRDVTDDAISILVIIALFLVTSGLVLGTITPGNPQMCIAIGAVCVLAGVGKLYVLRRYVGFPVGAMSFAGLSVILGWNFLVPPLMAMAFVKGQWPDEVRRLQWLAGWLVFLCGAVLVLIDAVYTNTDDENGSDEETAFIRRPAMVWVFTLVLLGAGCFYQYAIGYMFVVDTVLGDYLPWAAVVALLGAELICWFRKKLMPVAAAVVCIPLVLTLLAILDRNIIADWRFGTELFWYPPVMLGVCGGVVLFQALRHRCTEMYYAAAAYGLGVLLTFGYTAQKLSELNWVLCGGGLFVIVLVLGIVKRNMALCFAAVGLLAGGLGAADQLTGFARRLDLTVPGAIVGIGGLGVMVVCLVFGRQVSKSMVIFSAVCMMLCVFDLQSENPGWGDLWILIVIAAVCAGLWIRTGCVYAVYFLCFPLLPRAYVFFVAMSSWGFIILSFLLLLLAGGVSFFYKQNLTGGGNPVNQMETAD